MRSSKVRSGSEPPSWMRPITDRLSPVIRTLIIVDALLFMFYVMVPQAKMFFEEHLALGPGAFSGELWQPFTALFVHLEPLGFFFNLIGLWFVGATVERAVGTQRFLKIFFGSGVAANALMLLVSTALGTAEIFAGSGTAVLALFVAFGAQYGRTPARIIGGLVLEARTLAAILVGFALLMALTAGHWPRLAGDLVAITLGYVLAGGRGEGLRGLWSSMRAKRSRRRYQVIEGGRSGGPTKPTYLN